MAQHDASTLSLLTLAALLSSGCIFIGDDEHTQRRAEVIQDSRTDDTAPPDDTEPPDPVDADGDGYAEDADCDDDDAAVFPGADERCNEIDDDCDGDIDEDDAIDAPTWYRDGDGDGYGNADASQRACEAPSGWVDGDDDCDDEAEDVHPGATELCNDVDDDCDERVDEDAEDAQSWYHDADGDGFGDPADHRPDCEAPADTVADNTDCDDALAHINPGATEWCNGVDDDCDEEIDEDDAADVSTWWPDADGDGWGVADGATVGCDQPSGTTSPATSEDCDDGDASVSPGAAETCNGVDDDCDGTVDNGATDATTWYRDRDSDGYGDDTMTIASCEEPSGYTAASGDCEEGDAAINPAATEVCDEVDNDCDGDIDGTATDMSTWYADADNDGYGDPSSPTTACDQPTSHVADDSDCDDSYGDINPAATEICDGLDNDCDGDVDGTATDMTTWYTDADVDGYGDSSSATTTCTQPSGTRAIDPDCDDGDDEINPGATELCDGVDNDCDGTDDDANTVTHWDSTGRATDLTSSFSGGSSSSATDLTLADSGTIQLCDGTYYVDFEVDASDLTMLSLNGASSTTIHGDNHDRVIDLNSGVTSFRLSGLTVTGGDGSNGGGLYGSSSSLSVSIQDSVFDDNAATNGGGVYMANATVTIYDTTISGGDASSDGGGLYITGGGVELQGVTVSDCIAEDFGGGIYLTSTTATFTDTVVENNATDDDGGGIYAYLSDLLCTSCEILTNSADNGGGGVKLDESSATFETSTIQGNYAQDWGGGLQLTTSTADLLSSLVIENETNTSSWYDVGGGALVYGGSTLTCTASSGEDAGIYSNYAGDGGGVYLYSSSDRLDSDTCDWGTGTEDNSPDDVDLYLYGSSYSGYGDDETFSCTGGSSGGCS